MKQKTAVVLGVSLILSPFSADTYWWMLTGHHFLTSDPASIAIRTLFCGSWLLIAPLILWV